MVLNLHLLGACKLSERIQDSYFNIWRTVERFCLSARRCRNTGQWNLAGDGRNCSFRSNFLCRRKDTVSFLQWLRWRIWFLVRSTRSNIHLVRDYLALFLRLAVWTRNLRRYNGGIDRSSSNGGLTSRRPPRWWRVFIGLIGLQRWIVYSIPAYSAISA